ncbi:MAG: sugar ABC transporter substrate-binding protein [Chloroflexota bacterium]|nr:sugar ABC transporter substrate-binding protein [Chloroflexota bacterium]
MFERKGERCRPKCITQNCSLYHIGGSGISGQRILRLLRLALAGLLIAVLILSSAGCLSGSSTREDNVQLVYQDWCTEWFPSMAREMLDQFQQEHPNVRVFYTPDPAAFRERMLTDFEDGTAPDVFQGASTHFPVFAQKGYCLDLCSYVETDLDQEIIDDWDEAQYNFFFTEDGRQYGLPKYHGALALYYNKDLFDQYGVDYPDETWDYDDYLNAMRLLTHDGLWGSMVDIAWDRLQIHINSWGGHFIDPYDPTRCLMAEPKALAAIEWLRARMWDDKVMATSLDVGNVSTRQAFIDQKVAMVEDGSWALKDILADADFRIGVAPFPVGPVRRVTLATNDGFGIWSGTEHPEAAWELVKFLISKDYGRAMARAHFLQPARASLVDEWVEFIQEEFPEESEGVDIAVFADGHIKGYSVTTEICANMDAAKQLASAAWEDIFTWGTVPASKLGDKIEELARQIEEAQ